MKVALCLSGQPRMVETGYKCHKHFILDRYDTDVFIHTWITEGINNLTEIGGDYVVSPNTKETICELYKPKTIVAEPQITTFPCYKHETDAIVFTTYSMFYSINESNKLKKQYEEENNFKYDVVIRSRFDAGILKEINLEEAAENTVYAFDAITNSSRICDWFLYGDSFTMDKVSSVYENIDAIFQSTSPCCGEEFLWKHCLDQGFGYEKIYPGDQGNALVLIRPDAPRSSCWKREEDVLDIINPLIQQLV